MHTSHQSEILHSLIFFSIDDTPEKNPASGVFCLGNFMEMAFGICPLSVLWVGYSPVLDLVGSH